MLILAQPALEPDPLLEPLLGRGDLCAVRVGNLNAAIAALRELPARLVVVCWATPAVDIDRLVTLVERSRPETAVLALREGHRDVPVRWRARGVAVLRLPVSPETLERTVDAALALADPAVSQDGPTTAGK